MLLNKLVEKNKNPDKFVEKNEKLFEERKPFYVQNSFSQVLHF
jgi:hypothetical protein